ncbi:hypothetical protein [Mycolicibacterium doricum]|uniref:hypothetical protein n=1 Tax=Mycolicibacterium doricum TaxID=126673 RepID=UPI001F477823|nr:hypothetical protein [Mycolicibacterium doricum]
MGGLIGALASAVVAADEGVDVLVATSATEEGWPADRVEDDETRAYFAALTDGLAADPRPTADVPVRLVRPLTAAERRRSPPFYGARLKKWTEQCLHSPYGLMHTRVSDWPITIMRTLENRPVQVKTVGRIALPAEGGPVPLATWLDSEARIRDIDVEFDTRLQRMVFEEDAVIGAVLQTGRGPYAVRARHGITLAPYVGHVGHTVADPVQGDDEAEVALVSEIGSRFARVELLAAAPTAVTQPATCASSNGKLPKATRESRRNRGEPSRSRETDGHPPFGQ